MIVIKRFHDCLLPTHQKVLDTAQRVKTLDVKDGFLRNASGYPFYNTSKFTFETLKADPDNIEDNFKDYLNGFSDNVQDILARMKFSDQVERLCDPDAPLALPGDLRLLQAAGGHGAQQDPRRGHGLHLREPHPALLRVLRRGRGRALYQPRHRVPHDRPAHPGRPARV